jgi:hypothetical protein
MKHLTIIALVIALFFGKALAQQQTQIKQAAQTCADAFTSGNYAKFADYTYPELLAKAGGKDSIIAAVKRTLTRLSGQGVTVESAVIGDPGLEYPGGTKLFCLVPQTITLKVNGGHLVSDSYLLAISTNKGQWWYFMDIAGATKASLKQLFPDFNNIMAIPAPVQPVFTKDPN